MPEPLSRRPRSTGPDALAAAREKSLAALSVIAEAVGRGDVRSAQASMYDDLREALDEMDLACENEIDKGVIRHG